MARYFNEKDLGVLQQQTTESIANARGADGVDDDTLAHLYELRGKLRKYAEAAEAEPDEKPAKRTRAGNGRARAPRSAPAPSTPQSPSPE